MAKQTREEVEAALKGHKSESVILSNKGARIVMITEIYSGGTLGGLTTLTTFRVEFFKGRGSERAIWESEHAISLDIALDLAMEYE